MPYYYNQSSPATAAAVMTNPSGMRLSGSSTLPVTDATGASTLYLLPYSSDCIWVPNSGGGWTLWRTSSVSLALSGLTSAKVYDIYLWDNAGTLTLSTGTAWTNATSRANALTTLNGVYVNGSTEGSMAASRGIWLGSLYSASTTTFNDSVTSRCLVNYFNVARRGMFSSLGYSDGNTATTWTSASTTWTAGNAGTGSQIEFINGKNANFDIFAASVCNNSGASGVSIGIGMDSTSTANCKAQSVGTNRASLGCAWADSALAEGYHTANLLVVVVANTGTFYADDIRSGGGTDPYMTYIRGSIDG